MKIAILGTRGIPNNYGGFEQLAEYLSVGLVTKGHDVYVYSPHNHSYREKTFKGVNILHQYDPEYKIGTAGQFIYDLNCIRDTRRHSFDIILQLGYTSSSVWSRLFPKSSIVITNMDGLEWKRTKFRNSVKKFIKYAEQLAVKHSDYFVSDSIGIQQYLLDNYQKESTYIAYGAHLFNDNSVDAIMEFSVKAYEYDMLIARLEPENSIETILKGVELSNSKRPFLVIGNHLSKYGNYLKNKFKDPRIHFLGAIYDIYKLDNLRYYSNLYFHGHTVGGTNPSLLEAMASNSLICANDNQFNRSILNEDAYYFTNEKEVRHVLNSVLKTAQNDFMIENNRQKIKHDFAWDTINNQYEALFTRCLKTRTKSAK
ncbi:DUF1972 domain-containing protein [Pontibacter sp. BT310]|uniref:DUF1972 domain-containing protein n=1 Tax=Pontibacter populi TaxID=890055 RepID=A0ABS6XBJ1_9BACT|nr:MULTISPECIES: DUF1972 domain-containing protein [Pontibacter]MBJ6118428.1 DUF1972 domain-containing protein [Pontibacter sp. BT310]MBR0570856.1 DUF1972 domain-containing protein [Microvirga sp. STS03]MBW3365282.1 DUF1972 domain-containing protein [Pontibacter populi]